jgi:hypothetical protein
VNSIAGGLCLPLEISVNFLYLNDNKLMLSNNNTMEDLLPKSLKMIDKFVVGVYHQPNQSSEQQKKHLECSVSCNNPSRSTLYTCW